MLVGVSLCGSHNNNYSATSNLLNSSDRSVVTSKSGIFRSEGKGRRSHFYYSFDVVFDEAVAISKDTKYCIEASIAGPIAIAIIITALMLALMLYLMKP